MFFRVEQAYEKCGIVKIPTKYDKKPLAWGIQKDSPFTDLFNYYLKDMKEKGSLNQIFQKYESQPQVCPDFSGKPLGFGSCFTAFGFLIIGAFLSCLLFALELIGGYAMEKKAGILNIYEQDMPKNMKYSLGEELIMLREEVVTLKKKLNIH